jgi:hypothetical protein
VRAFSNTSNCVARRARLRTSGQRVRWFEQKRLSWVDGYRILLRIETHFWWAGERIPDVQEILDSCRRLVMLEMGYRVS